MLSPTRCKHHPLHTATQDLKKLCGFAKGCAATTLNPAGAQLWGQLPSPKHWGKCPIPKPCLCLGPCRVVTAMQHPAPLFSRLPVVLRCWLHLSLPYLEKKGATLGCVRSPLGACMVFLMVQI